MILSEEEQTGIENILNQLEKEYNLPIDNFSHELIIANLDLLFSYCNRYYNRQFIMRKSTSNALMTKFESILRQYFLNKDNNALPTAGYLASEMNVSVKYLNDSLKQLTGQTTQQLIHEKVIEEAKALLSTSTLSVSEIAYRLGFEYPQSFNKLFRNKVEETPNEYRARFN